MDQDQAKERHIVFVASKIYEKIPESELEFKAAMKNFIYKDLPYKAPETLNNFDSWSTMNLIFNKYIKNNDEPWKKECIHILTGSENV